ncbi:MAG: tRNA (N(6)-L-threonylcarbamoyladenosine(37)-C(2))-methylthiotransferase MtaB [Clostridiales bacterium]|nr:tRNA (N(6)-L-threonylcarbamoyladenosine(37)-C(2))-methylthiotransferase MtaB [Clostridiales bacterium]
MKAVVFTLGCKVNSCESNSLIKGLEDLGFEVSDELEFADLYIINTCAVTKEAEKKSRQAIARVKKQNPLARIIVTGCASEKNPESFSRKNGVHVVTGTSSKEKILELIEENGQFIFPPETEYHELPLCKTIKSRAYVKIQDGCNNFCSYCIIPYLRGRSRSRSPESIKNEIIALNADETVLTAINLSAYNYEGKNLTCLIESLADVNTRIRFGSLEENVISEELLIALKNLKDFAPHFHLSLQSGSDNTLKAMNRKYTAKEYKDGVNLIRKYFPNAGITTDVIVGYPTETELDFIDSYNFIKEIEFSDVHAFCFSPREGTVAYKLKDLDGNVKRDRLNKLLELKEILKSRFISKNLQTFQDVIIEEFEDGYSCGYTGNYIKTYIKGRIENGKYKVCLTEKYKQGALAEIKEKL